MLEVNADTKAELVGYITVSVVGRTVEPASFSLADREVVIFIDVLLHNAPRFIFILLY